MAIKHRKALKSDITLILGTHTHLCNFIRTDLELTESLCFCFHASWGLSLKISRPLPGPRLPSGCSRRFLLTRQETRSVKHSPCMSRRDNTGGITAAQFPSLGALPAMTTRNGNTSTCGAYPDTVARRVGRESHPPLRTLLTSIPSKKDTFAYVPYSPSCFFFLPAPYHFGKSQIEALSARGETASP